jgi:hypothetical protein
VVVKEAIVPILMLLVGYILGRINSFGRRKGIHEARFDSETGKEIE